MEVGDHSPRHRKLVFPQASENLPSALPASPTPSKPCSEGPEAFRGELSIPAGRRSTALLPPFPIHWDARRNVQAWTSPATWQRAHQW